MPLTNINNTNFPDRSFDNPNWLKVLPVVDNPLQASELIEMQSILQKNLAAGLSGILNNGIILSGLEVRELDRTELEIIYSVNSGKLLIDGVVIEVAEGSINVPLTGEYVLSVKVDTFIINADYDANLRNPANGGAQYGDEGASRLIYETTLTYNELNTYPIARVVNGELFCLSNNKLKDVNEKVEKYIYERNGNFVVNGLKVNLLSINRSIRQEDNNYDNLVTQSQTAESEVLRLSALNVEYTQSRQNLEAQIIEAGEALVVNASAANQLILNQLQQELEQVNKFFTSNSLDLANHQLSLSKINDQLEIEQNLYADNFNLSVDSGIAYILGKRIAPHNPITLNVPIESNTRTVDDAIFYYRGQKNYYDLEFILANALTWNFIDQNNYQLRLKFRQILINDQLMEVDVTVPLSAFKNTQNFNDNGNLNFNINQFLSLFVDDYNALGDTNLVVMYK